MEIPTAIIKIIKTYLNNRTFCTHVNGQYSSPKSINAGVPQGSVFGPTLYNLFTADIPTTKETQLAIYADDTPFYTQSRSTNKIIINLQKHLKLYNDWTRTWKIQINPDKSQSIKFTNHPKKHKPEKQLQLNNIKIPWENKVTYLGINFTKDMTFK